MAKKKILILGGTTQARQLAGRLAASGAFDVTLSLAGRTENPVAQPVPVRTGGFGGAEGLASHLRAQKMELLIDATHPYAARISVNAAQAAKQTNVPLVALRRPAWEAVTGDRWTHVGGVEQAVAALGDTPRRVFLALGRQEVAPFRSAPRHRYLVRSVEPVDLGLAYARYILARGPFAEADDHALLSAHGIDALVAKNSGGTATYGKIAAARSLGIDVILIERPALPDVPAGETVEAVIAMIEAHAGLAKRGE